MVRFAKILKAWLPLAVVITGFCALAYMTVQQSLRQGANDPQIQMAEDAAAALNRGAGLEAVVPAAQVELSSSLAPFIVVYDSSGRAVASSGLLDGKMPDYPIGALQAAQQSGENRVTWQPNPSVRVASVVVPYRDGYVMAGRNLREAERREAQTETIAGTVWLATLAAALAAVAAGEFVIQ